MILLFGFLGEVFTSVLIEGGVRATGYFLLKVVGVHDPSERDSILTGLILLVIAVLLVVWLIG